MTRTPQPRLGLESPLPKMAGHFFFFVSKTSNLFRQTLHEPRHIRQPLPLFLHTRNVVADLVQLEFRGFLRRPVFPASLRKQGPPPQGNVLIGPLPDNIRSCASHDVKVVTHDRKTKHVHGEDPGEHFQRSSLPPSQTRSSLSLGVTQLLPLFAIRVVSPCDVIMAAQIHPANTAIHEVKHVNLVICKHLIPIHPWHDCRAQKPKENHPQSPSYRILKVSAFCIMCIALASAPFKCMALASLAQVHGTGFPGSSAWHWLPI